ncbi:MAG TPA: hypothetical protein VGR56_08850 [Nitrososphaerales archaeon]|nr:hypothetical protein [Nitrososphaerales archaeon]
MVTVVGVSRPRTSGSYVTKSGKKAYRGNRKHWYVYFYDDDGRFKKRQISPIQVPYYGSLIRRRKTYLCPKCGTKFRSLQDSCPKCGTRAVKVRDKTPGLGKNLKAP